MHSDIVERMFTAVEKRDLDTYLTFFTEDAEYRAANLPPVFGHKGIAEFAKPMMDMFTKVDHIVKDVWQSGDVICCELDLTYVRKDGKSVTVPCCDIIRLQGGKVKSLRAFLDPGPAFA